jgi:hypothetical protein
VNLRLSEEEYQTLISNCVEAKARSICEYARTTLCRQTASSHVSNEDLYLSLTRLTATLQDIAREMRQFGVQLASWQRHDQ